MTDWHKFPDEKLKESGYYILRLERDINLFEYAVAWINVENLKAYSAIRFGRGNITHWIKFEPYSPDDSTVFHPWDFRLKTDWHKYTPRSRPKMSDDEKFFWITYENPDGSRDVTTKWWDAPFRTFANVPETMKIIAWARVDVPKPYEGD